MIYVLEFDMSIDYKLAWNVAARATFHIFYNLPKCMILYRHKLAETYLWTKFGCNNPDKIVFDKLDGKNLILFHTDVYMDNTHKLSDLIEYCNNKNIDIWIPFPKKNLWRNNEPHISIMRNIIDNYNNLVYDLTGMNYRSENEIPLIINEKTKSILRDLKLKKLLD